MGGYAGGEAVQGAGAKKAPCPQHELVALGDDMPIVLCIVQSAGMANVRMTWGWHGCYHGGPMAAWYLDQ